MNYPANTDAKKEVEIEFESSLNESQVAGKFKHLIAQ